MDENKSENVCQVPRENGLGKYRLHTFWDKNKFAIKILGSDSAWCGEMPEDKARSFSSNLNLSLETYLSECKQALTSHNGQENVFYSVEDGQFVWKKIIDVETGIKVKLGSVMVKPANFNETFESILNFSLVKSYSLMQNLRTSEQEDCGLKSYNEQLLKKHQELLESKNKMETELFSTFLLLLNSKKLIIKNLEQELKNCKGSVGTSVKTTTPTRQLKKRTEEVRTEEQDYNAETEDDSCEGEEEKTNDKTKTKCLLRKRKANEHKSKTKKVETVVKNKRSCITKSVVDETLRALLPSCSKERNISDEEVNKNTEKVVESSKICQNIDNNDTDETISDESLMSYETNNKYKETSAAQRNTDLGLPTSKSDLLDFFYGGSKNDLESKTSSNSVNKTFQMAVEPPRSAVEKLMNELL